MIEKVSADFVGQLYLILTTGNEDINFLCNCLRNQNHEAATNNPMNFALKLLKINIASRLPIIKNRLFCEEIGKSYLCQKYLRPAVWDLASGVLDNSHIVTDIFSSAFVLMKSREDIFALVERQTNANGFAKLRLKFDNDKRPLEHIYNQINQRLGIRVDYHLELELIKKFSIKNRYVTRLLDIACANDVEITAFVRSSYPRCFIEKMIKDCGIYVNKLIISNEDAYSSLAKHYESTAVLSSDYSYIKKFMKRGCIAVYYRPSRLMLQKVKHPKLDKKFREIYDCVCGTRLFEGMRSYSRVYELAYLCIAPAVFGYAQCLAKTNGNVAALDHSRKGGLLLSLVYDKICEHEAFPKDKPSADTVELKAYLGSENRVTEIIEKLITCGAPATCKLVDKRSNSKIPPKRLKEVFKAVMDFTADFCKYFCLSSEPNLIKGSDALALLLQGQENISKYIGN